MIQIASVFEIESVLNTPDVLASFSLTGEPISMAGFYQFPVDYTPKDLSFWNIGLIHDGAVMLFARLDAHRFDSHFLFPAHCRGKRGIAAASAMIHEMFTRYGANAIEGHPPRVHRAVRVFGTRLGYLPTGTTSIDGLGRECVDYELRRDQWLNVLRDSSSLQSRSPVLRDSVRGLRLRCENLPSEASNG